jgi:hypothetical protein
VTAVKEASLDQYRIVYFATHALVAGEVGQIAKIRAEPALALSLPDKPTEVDDGLLKASEVAELKLDADIVVLSACNTAAGDKPGAEALSGLARAFLYAGARSLIVSHWPVDSDAAVRLMTSTFAAMDADRSLTPSQALRKSMLAMIDDPADPDAANPSLWAPFIVVGEARPKGKDTDRLLDSGAPPAKAVHSVEPPPDDNAAPAAPAAADEASPTSPAAPLVASTNDNDGAGGVLVAQKAFLFEEVVNANGDTNAGLTALDAAVTWRYVENGADGPAIEANLQVPERKLKLRLTIHKNADHSLPASHLIEIQIDAPPDLPGKGIKEVPRIVFKPTEEARGQPLVGEEAKITDGSFLIALSAADADISANLALLRERDWIDLPFIYETGQRAMLTFEKGTQGDQVFQKAMAAWTAG